MSQNDITELKTIRDEIRLKIHLAAMDARDEWKSLEPQLEKAMNNLASIAKESLHDLQQRAKRLQAKL